MFAVVSHDAGGAEILSSYVRRRGEKAVFVLAGPALRVFERKLGPIENAPLDQAVRQAAWVLCGTSGQSALEVARRLDPDVVVLGGGPLLISDPDAGTQARRFYRARLQP